MQAYIILILLLVLIILAALFQKPAVGNEHFFETGFRPVRGTGTWGESPPCTDQATGFQEDAYSPGRYWGWLKDTNQSCAFYEFSNEILPDWQYKQGNNGAKSCLEFCRGAEYGPDKPGQSGKPINGCIGGWDSKTNKRIDCNTVLGAGTAQVQCWCQKGEGVPNDRTRLSDGNEYNVCNNPALANTRDTEGRMWGYENGASCVVK
jgi:hypothetical protein